MHKFMLNGNEVASMICAYLATQRGFIPLEGSSLTANTQIVDGAEVMVITCIPPEVKPPRKHKKKPVEVKKPLNARAARRVTKAASRKK